MSRACPVSREQNNAIHILSDNPIDRKPVEMEIELHRSSTDGGIGATRKHEQGQLQDQELGPLPPSKPAKSPILSNMNKYWVWEVLSCAGSLIALVSIIGVLLSYDGKPIPNWPYGVTINTALSFIIQVFSGFMLGTVAACLSQNAWIHFSTADRPLSDINSYHWASRGVWGSLTFLWGARPRIKPLSKHEGFTTMASLGCLITILTIGVGPFVQQMSTVRNIRVPTNLPAYIGRGQSYSEKSPDYLQIPGGMVAAIYSNIFQGLEPSNQQNNSLAVSSPNAPVTCPSGECEFPIFRSLTVCSECYDLSSLIETRCEKTNCFPEEKTHCTHSLSTQMSVNVSDIDREELAFHKTAYITLPSEIHSQIDFKDFEKSWIFNSTQIKVPSNKAPSHATASLCSLYWCVKTYSAAVRNNTLKETVIDTWYDPNPRRGEMESEPLLKDIYYLEPPKKDSLPQNAFAFPSVVTDYLSYWLLTKLGLDNTRRYLCESLGSYVPSRTFDKTRNLTYRMDQNSDFQYTVLHNDLTDIFKAIEDAVTSRIRQWDWNSQSDSSPRLPVEGTGAVNGTSFMVETQIHVKWAWIVLPCSLLVMTMIFMGITAWNTRRMGLEVWKSSPTALICSGLDEDIQQEVRTIKDPVGMEQATSNVPVRLGQCNDVAGDYWKLERVNRFRT